MVGMFEVLKKEFDKIMNLVYLLFKEYCLWKCMGEIFLLIYDFFLYL